MQMQKKNIISEEEYLSLKERLKEILIDKENIFKIYDTYFSKEEVLSSDKVMNLVMILTRRNQSLAESINLEKKKYFSTCRNQSTIFKTLVSDWIDGDLSQVAFLNMETDFSVFEKKIADLKEERDKNKDLLQAIIDNMNNERLVTQQIKSYEKQQKKNATPKRKILSFKKKNNKIN